MPYLLPLVTHEAPEGLPEYTPDREKIPQGTKVVTAEDLNGQFAPQSGNIQPQIATIPETVQVNFNHPADRSDEPLVAIIDDWAHIAASVAREVLETLSELDVEPDVEAVEVIEASASVLPIIANKTHRRTRSKPEAK